MGLKPLYTIGILKKQKQTNKKQTKTKHTPTHKQTRSQIHMNLFSVKCMIVLDIRLNTIIRGAIILIKYFTNVRLPETKIPRSNEKEKSFCIFKIG